MPSGYQMWEMDHTIPVSEGGGCCGLDNLRTLCVRCHKTVTARLAARAAAQKRAEQGRGEQLALAAIEEIKHGQDEDTVD